MINTDTFRYYKKEFLQQITHYPTCNLLLRRSLKFNGIEKKGAYGTYSGTISSSSYTNLTPSQGGGYTKLTPDQNNVYIFNDDYYFSKNGDQFYPATKKGANELFARNQQQLKNFLEQHTINFEKKEDLEKILELAVAAIK